MAKDYLFLYGTLRSGGGSPMHDRFIAPHCRRIGEAHIQGRLYDLGRYPGLVHSANREHLVRGEIWLFNSALPLLRQLDDYEGCSPRFPRPWEYRRERKSVTLESGERLKAWVYVYNGRTNPFKRLKSGDYLRPL